MFSFAGFSEGKKKREWCPNDIHHNDPTILGKVGSSGVIWEMAAVCK